MSKEVCEFEKLEEVPEKIISVSLFIKNYDEKFIEKYEEKSIDFFKNYKKHFPDYKLIVYGDRTINKSKKIYEAIQKSELNVIIYNCESLIEKKSKEHKGLIGTLMRYYPLFQREYKGVKEILITDIDLYEYNIESMKMCIEYMRYQKRMEFMFKTNGVRYRAEWENGRYPQIVSITIISKIQFPQRIFEEFLEKIAGSKKKIIEGVNKENKKRLQELSYGIDEYFLNYYLMPWIVEKDIIYGMRTSWEYKQILNVFSIEEGDMFTEEKIKMLEKLKKKDVQMLNELLDELKINVGKNIIEKCKRIQIKERLNYEQIKAIKNFVQKIRKNEDQKFFTEWQMRYIQYNKNRKDCVQFLTLKGLNIISDLTIYDKRLLREEKKQNIY